MKNALGTHLKWRKNLYLHLLAGESGHCHRLLREPNEFRDKDFLSTKFQRPFWREEERVQVRVSVVLRMGKYPWRWKNDKLANDKKMWKGDGNTTTLLFSLKGLEILHQERSRQMNITVKEQFNSILFQKSGPVKKQHINQFYIPPTWSQDLKYVALNTYCGMQPSRYWLVALIPV